MTTSFPETKTGLRFGLASLALTTCLAAVLAAGLPVRAQDNPVLAKVNGVEIRQSDVALAEEELGPSLAQMDPATKKDNVLAFLIDLQDRRQGRRGQEGREFRGLQAAHGVHAQPAFDGQPARHRRQGWRPPTRP